MKLIEVNLHAKPKITMNVSWKQKSTVRDERKKVNEYLSPSLRMDQVCEELYIYIYIMS